MKRLFLLPLILVFVLAAALFWFFKSVQPLSKTEDFQSFLITKGSSAGQIAGKLQSAGIIRSALAFKIYVQFTGQSGKIQTGEFRLSPSLSLFQVVSQLQSGPVELWVTIPEGLRREEIASKFASSLSRDSGFSDEFLQVSKGDEGMLFPDTYLFPKDASPSAIVSKMLRTFQSKTSDLSPASGLSFNERIVLASLIERETKTAEERPIVAGILIKRLNAGWPLQVDASVQYAVGTPKNWWPILTAEDLTITSSYNSYKYAGLPPAPIASPGLSSILASFNPQDSDYWYYIHDTSGKIHYAKTLEEHNANIAKYLGK